MFGRLSVSKNSARVLVAFNGAHLSLDSTLLSYTIGEMTMSQSIEGHEQAVRGSSYGSQTAKPEGGICAYVRINADKSADLRISGKNFCELKIKNEKLKMKKLRIGPQKDGTDSPAFGVLPFSRRFRFHFVMARQAEATSCRGGRRPRRNWSGFDRVGLNSSAFFIFLFQ
jgi:hypothetical protein